MRFVKGRDNLSVTVYVPYNCTNNCSFCTSKVEYKGVATAETNLTLIEDNLRLIRFSTIREVVFTGGEPMMNLKVLKRMVEIVSNKDVYINTTLINKNLDNFIEFVNNTPCIKGVNISRHSATFKEDAKQLDDIAFDKELFKIYKKIKINVVLPKKVTAGWILAVLERWADLNDIEVSFRPDFNKVTPEQLHSLDDPILVRMLALGDFDSRTYCDVCDTTRMFRKSTKYGVDYSYHRGLANTSIRLGNTIIVNDIIMFPNGELCYDWDHRSDNIQKMMAEFSVVPSVSSESRELQELLQFAKEYMKEHKACQFTGHGCGGNGGRGC